MGYRDNEEAAHARAAAPAREQREEDRRLAAIAELGATYVAAVGRWCEGSSAAADEQLLRSIEDRMSLGESQRVAWRQNIGLFVQAIHVEGKPFDIRSNAPLLPALELVVAERSAGK